MPPYRQPGRVGPGPSADMTSTFTLGQMQVRRSGYGAMQLAGPDLVDGAGPGRPARHHPAASTVSRLTSPSGVRS